VLKTGVVQLKQGTFPKLQDGWTDFEKEHMLLLLAVDVGEGLHLIQTVPELMVEDKCLAYSDRNKAAIDLYYPIIETSMNKEFIQAKIICMLNAAMADEKNPSYEVLFQFICDKDYKNFKLAGIFQGEASQGVWAPEQVVAGIASNLSMEVYKQAENGNEAKG